LPAAVLKKINGEKKNKSLEDQYARPASSLHD